jgi:hypothetical protein
MRLETPSRHHVTSLIHAMHQESNPQDEKLCGISVVADKPLKNESLPDAEIAARMDRAIRRSLQMPPKLHKDSRKPRRRKVKAADAKPETEPS